MTGQWNELLCQYFKTIVLKVLGPYFNRLGFYEKMSEDDTGVFFFTSEGLFVELSYDPELSPAYTPSVIIGMGGRKFDDAGQSQCVPLWFVIPEKAIERPYSSWRFASEKQLEETLMKIQSEILDKYAMPLLRNENLLKEKINLFR